MLFLITAFGVLLYIIARAPQEVTRLCLAAFWVLLLGGCAASVVSALVG